MCVSTVKLEVRLEEEGMAGAGNEGCTGTRALGGGVNGDGSVVAKGMYWEG